MTDQPVGAAPLNSYRQPINKNEPLKLNGERGEEARRGRGLSFDGDKGFQPWKEMPVHIFSPIEKRVNVGEHRRL